MWLTPTSGIRPPEEHTEGYFVPYRHIGLLGCYYLRGRFEDTYAFEDSHSSLPLTCFVCGVSTLFRHLEITVVQA
jgi:hypothetical protein